MARQIKEREGLGYLPPWTAYTLQLHQSQLVDQQQHQISNHFHQCSCCRSHGLSYSIQAGHTLTHCQTDDLCSPQSGGETCEPAKVNPFPLMAQRGMTGALSSDRVQCVFGNRSMIALDCVNIASRITAFQVVFEFAF